MSFVNVNEVELKETDNPNLAMASSLLLLVSIIYDNINNKDCNLLKSRDKIIQYLTGLKCNAGALYCLIK